jgi:tetratricopeptide (TPR) repeat protein
MNLARLTDNNVDLLNFAIHNFQEGLRLDETIAEQLKIASSIEKDLRQIIQNKIDGYSNLGITYSALAGKINDSFLAEKGVEALKHALILGKEHCINDLEIGHLKMNLGVALDELGRLNQDKLMLTQAIHTNKEALTIFETDKTTQYWARTNHNLGIAQERLGRVDKNIPLLKSAVEAYNEALKIWDLNRYPANFAGTNKHLGKTLQTLGLLEENRFILIESKRAFQKALTIFKSLNNFNECEKTRLCLNSVKANLRELATETLR